MSDVYRFAQQLIDSSDAIKAARSAEGALEALERLECITTDHEMLALLAKAFCLLTDILPERPPESVDKPVNSATYPR